MIRSGRCTTLLMVVVATGAITRAQTSSVLAQFDFREKAAVRAKLPRALQEISGLAVTSDGRVFAHADERGVIAQIDACGGVVKKSFTLGRTALRGDFEGIAIAGERFFLITSIGHLYEFREGANGAAAAFRLTDTGFGKLCELEGLAYEPAERVLLIGCKQPLQRELRGGVHILRWSLDQQAAATPPSLTIPLAAVLRRVGGKNFQTSAIERDVGSGNYVLVAGPERKLIEVTAEGAVVAAQSLARQLHPQPESVTFLGDTVLVVADEGAGGRASVTCYRRAR